MIPILYEASETSFLSNGIGRLVDCLRLEVTEERNGIFELEFDYPVNGQHYDDITEGRIIASVHDDNKDVQPFDIYGRSAPIDGIVTFYAHHSSYRLQYSILQPFTATSCADAFSQMQGKCVTSCPFAFWTDKTTAGTFTVSAPVSVKEILGGTQGSILDVYGKGEYEWDKFTVKLHLNRGADTGVQIRYGKNLSDMTQELDTSGFYSAVVPFWKGNDGTLVTLTNWILNSAAASAGTVPVKAVPMDLSDQWEEAPTETQLRNKALSRMEDAKAWLPDENIKVDFVALWQTDDYANVAPLEQVRLCDRVDIINPELGVTAESVQIIKVVYDGLLERYISMELGTARTSFASVVQATAEAVILPQVPTKSFLQTVVEKLSAEINAGAGGIIVDVNDANGNRSEILILCDEGVTVDTPPEKCQHIWRINKAGIGYSSDYGRTYTLAITASGQIVADFITTGLLHANIIKVGVLSDANGTNYWNMETGEFRLASTTTVGGKTITELIDESSPELTQEQIFNILTNNGQVQGIYLKNGKLYLNATYIDTGTLSADKIKGGTLTLGGSNNANGVFVLNNSRGTEVARMDNTGLTSKATSGSHTLESTLDAGELKFLVDSNTTLDIAPLYDSSGYGYTGFSVYRPLFFVRGGGGNCLMRLAGYYGDDSAYNNGTYFGYPVKINSSLTVTGTKNREAETENYNKRLLYCYEMPSPMFGDIGNGQTDDTGECIVEIDDVFSETVRTNIAYQVFLQKEGLGDIYVAQKNAHYFVVKGTPNLSFAWELKAKQAGFENLRLDERDFYEAEEQEGLLESLYDYEIDTIYNELEALYETA